MNARLGTGRGRFSAFTMVEVVVSLGVAAVMLAGLVAGYVQTMRRAEWSAYNLAAQSLALQRLEQTRAAKWDTQQVPMVDQVLTANFPVRVEQLDVPISGTNVVWATNVTTVGVVSVDPPLKVIQVDCTWAFYTGGVFTNTVVTYRAPDQ